ncbi:MAG TPA: SDR family oxidoreductase [Saprospiraceae bacterium]|nr:SDR family oxidoreductase [Saprospiraceae bacterium]
MKILITGASRGIGYDTALQLAQAGHRVLALARNAERLEALAEQAAGNIFPLPQDLVKLDQARLTGAIEKIGGLDILINNAGLLVNKPFLDLSSEDWQNSFQVNVFAVVELIRLCLPFLAKSPQAHILNIGSMGGYPGSQKFLGLAAYSASKGALATLTESLAVELREQKVAVNCLALGAVQTEMLESAFPGYSAPTNSEEMGTFVAQFATTAQRLFNGKIIPVSQSNP